MITVACERGTYDIGSRHPYHVEDIVFKQIEMFVTLFATKIDSDSPRPVGQVTCRKDPGIAGWKSIDRVGA